MSSVTETLLLRRVSSVTRADDQVVLGIDAIPGVSAYYLMCRVEYDLICRCPAG